MRSGCAPLPLDAYSRIWYAESTQQRNQDRETMAENTAARHVTIAGKPFDLRHSDVLEALQNVEPEPISSHFVVVGSRRFPPKQVIGQITGLDRADFTTHQARRTLLRLGFTAGRRGSSSNPTQTRAEAPDESLAERMRAFTGEWIAIKNDEILHASSTPQALVRWLGNHGQKADSVFRVPEDDLAAGGLAPL
jgi:hypothetical protein